MPWAPDLFSTMNDFPVARDSAEANFLAMPSVGPPGANGAIIRTG